MSLPPDEPRHQSRTAVGHISVICYRIDFSSGANIKYTHRGDWETIYSFSLEWQNNFNENTIPRKILSKHLLQDYAYSNSGLNVYKTCFWSMFYEAFKTMVRLDALSHDMY